jgi:CheY-like chemotaxis protein
MFVLIVDDDAEDRELFMEAVSKVNPAVRLHSAKDGREAIQILTNGIPMLPDFIFLDINMPLMNGRECLVEIRRNPKLKSIPVVMYSTTSDTKEIQSFYKLGAHDFLIKPNNFNKLVEALDSIIRVDQRNGRRSFSE